MMDFILLTVVSALLGAMLPGAVDNGIKKVFAFLAGVILLLAIARPIFESVHVLTGVPEWLAGHILPQEEELEAEEENALAWVINFSTQNIEQGVNALLVHRYGLPEESVESIAELEMGADGQWRLDRMVIRLPLSAQCDDGSVAQYLQDVLSCACKVVRIKEST